MDKQTKRPTTPNQTTGSKQEIKKDWGSKTGQQQKGTQQGGFNPQGDQTGKK